ncbi:MAG: signal transduction histidine kinase, partial [Enterobacterales bacterium]
MTIYGHTNVEVYVRICSKFIKTIMSYYSGKKSIGKTLLLWILFYSSLVTVVLSGVQLYVDYKQELNAIDSRFVDIESSYLRSIEASLWNVDREQLHIQLEGIKQLPNVQRVVVKEIQNVSAPIILEKGLSEPNGIKREYNLNHEEGGDTFVVGILSVEVSLSAVYQRLINKALTIMLVQGIKTFLVSFFILFVFYRLVTRHIIAIQHFLKNVNLQAPFTELRLSRRTRKVSDELDHLVSAYNAMTADLLQAYEDVRTVNVQLKKDIVARRLAEAEVSLLNEQLEHRVRVRTNELEAANKELNAFCYSVSHDLRAPLRRIDGFRNNLTLKYTGKIDSQGEHYLSRMQACSSEMNAMIDSFLVLSRSTNTELTLTEVNLSEMVSNTLANLQEKDQHRQVSLQIQKNMVALCDAGLVELLINNVIDNAWKYSANREKAVIRFSRKKCKGERIYIIEDNGAGFDMNLAENLFSPFTRLHKLSDFQGIGIGLATVKRVAARHGGRVWAESSVDQ